jgi:peptide/nickel transport system substrate-binding protein
MAINYRILDALRRGRTAHENHLIDGLVAARVSRREFMRYGSVLGLSLPFLGSVAAAVGYAVTPSLARAGTPGGTIRIAQNVPAASVDPVKIADGGGITVISQVAETLVLSGGDLTARPVLAESWSPNKDGTVWTFKLRKGVKFHNGKEMKADDVVASLDRLADPDNGSNALSALSGVLSKGGTRKVDDYTVEFHLDAANGNFPYYVSTDNYNAVILPADYKGDFEQNMIATGPFTLEKYTPKVGASFVRNDDYWGGKPLPDRVELGFYSDYQPQILALQSGQIDIIEQIPVLQGVGLLNDPNVDIISTPSSAHQQVHMRTDLEPFKDKRVRRAIALCLDRPKLVQGLMKGRAKIGNDSPFASAFPSTDPDIKQREKNIAEAKQLLEAAGMKKGFKTTLTTEKYLEIPDYAVLIQNAVKEIGGDITVNVLDQGAYYGDAVYGKSPWLDSDMGITDYGHRGVPNVFLAAPLKSDGTWNSAHFKNKEYDKLAAEYIAAVDLSAQRASAKKIQELLLDEVPIIFSYFYFYLSATKPTLAGVNISAMGQVDVSQAGEKA